MRMYIEWEPNVNKIILDNAEIQMGENATVSDSLENGDKRKRLALTFVPDTYSVTMDFDWVHEIADGLTEKDLFIQWYKYKHKYGVNPFKFPSIILGPSRSKYSYYTIENAVRGVKHGDYERFTLTFKEYYSGAIEITEVCQVDHVEVENGTFYITLTTVPASGKEKDFENVSVTKNEKTFTLNNKQFFYDGDKTVRMTFDKLTEPGIYKFMSGDFSVKLVVRESED